MTELEAGINVEKEHLDTYEWLIREVYEWVRDRQPEPPSFEDFCKHIAEDHLKEASDYYSKLEKAKL
jgi:hypothetical protein